MLQKTFTYTKHANNWIHKGLLFTHYKLEHLISYMKSWTLNIHEFWSISHLSGVEISQCWVAYSCLSIYMKASWPLGDIPPWGGVRQGWQLSPLLLATGLDLGPDTSQACLLDSPALQGCLSPHSDYLRALFSTANLTCSLEPVNYILVIVSHFFTSFFYGYSVY